LNPEISKVKRDRTVLLAALVFLYLLGFALNSTYLLPHTAQMNLWDEVVYIVAGKDFIRHHILWPYPRGPLIAVTYGLLYPLTPNSEYWLIAADMLGRITAYTLLFVSAWLVGRELEHRKLAPALLLVAVFTTLPFYNILLPNPSYWTFTVCVSLTLWAVLLYARTQRITALIVVAVMSAASLMSRPDLVFGASALIATVLVTRPWRSKRTVAAVALMAGIPAACIGIYIVAFGLQTGSYLFGAEYKLYDTFEAANQVLFNKDETKNEFDFETAAKAKAASEQAFGSAAENNHSVLRAIARNPSRFALMVWRNTVRRTVPDLLSAFGIRIPPVGFSDQQVQIRYLGFAVFFFAIVGITQLCRQRLWPILLVLLVFPADMGLYLLTISFPGYYLFHFMIALLLATVGLWAVTARLDRWWMPILLGAVALSFILPDWSSTIRIALFGAGISLLLVLAAWHRNVVVRYRGLAAGLIIASLLLLNLPTAYRYTWPGEDAGYFAQAKYLRDNYLPSSGTFAYPGLAAASAGMWWIQVWPGLAEIRSKESFLATMKLAGKPVILIDPWLKHHNIYNFHTSFEKYADEYYRTVWRSKDGRFAVLEPKDLRGTTVKPRHPQ
jgi:hypothetical protein